jgi:hypothetical protein
MLLNDKLKPGAASPTGAGEGSREGQTLAPEPLPGRSPARSLEQETKARRTRRPGLY